MNKKHDWINSAYLIALGLFIIVVVTLEPASSKSTASVSNTVTGNTVSSQIQPSYSINTTVDSSIQTSSETTQVLPNAIKTLPKEASQVKVTIKASQIEYYHLGEHVSISHEYNGQKIESGDIISVTGDRITIKTTIVENDSIPDYSSGSVTVPIPYDNSRISQTITVRETGGRKYPDAYAIWSIEYTFQVQ